ncbi:MAG: hypothetical protein IJ740_08995 [Ruminococcus sp.]|nr:hypothetical protein [Ruminococcus sp.]
MIKKLVAIIGIAIFSMIFSHSAHAADTAEFSLSKQHGYLGEEITATLTINSDGYDIADVQGNISYNDKVLSYVDSDCVTYAGGGNLTIRKFTDTGAESSCTMTITFKTIGEGDGFIKLINCQITDIEQNGIRSPSASTSIEVSSVLETSAAPAETTAKKETKKSKKTTKQTEGTPEETTTTEDTSESETTTTTTTTAAPTETTVGPADGEIPEGKLASVKISTGYISPAFSYDVLEYEIKVPYDCTWLDLEGVTSREGEYIWYTGDENVYDGVITRTIAVRDSQGNETVYTFNISRMTQDEQDRIEQSLETVTQAPEDSVAKVTTTTRKLSLEKNSSTFKKLIIGAAAVILVVIVIIVALISSRSSKKKRKKIKHSRKK